MLKGYERRTGGDQQGPAPENHPVRFDPSRSAGKPPEKAGRGRYQRLQQPATEYSRQGAGARYEDFNFDGPDNVTVTPWGSLVLAEDGNASSHVLSSAPGGPTYAIVRNMLNDSEFTGPAFSEDGKVLFVNLQSPGITFAITGPWRDYLG